MKVCGCVNSTENNVYGRYKVSYNVYNSEAFEVRTGIKRGESIILNSIFAPLFSSTDLETNGNDTTNRVR